MEESVTITMGYPTTKGWRSHLNMKFAADVMLLRILNDCSPVSAIKAKLEKMSREVIRGLMTKSLTCKRSICSMSQAFRQNRIEGTMKCHTHLFLSFGCTYARPTQPLTSPRWNKRDKIKHLSQKGHGSLELTNWGCCQCTRENMPTRCYCLCTLLFGMEVKHKKIRSIWRKKQGS